MDITPLISKDTKIINKYGDQKFIINTQAYYNNLILVNNNIYPIEDLNEIDQIVKIFLENNIDTEILLIGSGKIANIYIKPWLKNNIKNINTEIMNLSSAVSTYNILVTESRKVSAILCWNEIVIKNA